MVSLVSPPDVPDDSDRESASLSQFVHWIHGILFSAGLAVLVGIVVADPQAWGRYSGLLVLLVVIALSHWQGRTHPRRSVAILVVGVWLLSCLSVLQFAGIHSASFVLFPFSIAVAGWMLGRRWLVATTLATFALALGVGLGELSGLFEPTPRAHPLIATMQIAAIVLVVGFLVDAARTNLSRSRDRAVRLSSDLAAQVSEVATRERQWAMLLNNVPAAIASFDAQSRLRNCNQRYADLFGTSTESIVGKTIQEYVPATALEQLREHWDKALAGEAQSYRRFNVHPQTHAVTWMDASVTPELEFGKVVGLYAVLVDVTDKVQAESEIRNLNADLEGRVARRTEELAQAMDRLQESREALVSSQAKATLSALVASVSHELTTPIGNSVLVATTLTDLSRQMQLQIDSGQVRKSSLLTLNRTLDEGSQLLLSNLARAETLLKNFKQVSVDQASEQRRTFVLDQMIGEVLSSLRPSLKLSPHRTVLDIPQGIAMDGLPGPLGQVVINLVNNAYLHAFEGITAGVLTIRAADLGLRVEISIADNGVGMDPVVRAQVFNPFFSTKIGRGGTGLGLSIVDSLVRKVLRGSLHIESSPGAGTAFLIGLPKVLPASE
jgi:PAS domain S-box-containing protein